MRSCISLNKGRQHNVQQKKSHKDNGQQNTLEKQQIKQYKPTNFLVNSQALEVLADY
jgi:hypothetical protein